MPSGRWIDSPVVVIEDLSLYAIKHRLNGPFPARLRCFPLSYTKYDFVKAPCLTEKSLVHSIFSAYKARS